MLCKGLCHLNIKFMKIISYILFIILIISCNKQVLDAGIPVDPLKEKYISLVPELKEFSRVKEGFNMLNEYFVVCASKDGKILICYLDLKERRVVYKEIFEAPSSLKSNFYIDTIISEGNQREHNSISLILSKDNPTLNVQMIIYTFEERLKEISIAFENKTFKKVSNLAFTHNAISFFIDKELFLYQKNTGHKLLSSKDTGIPIMKDPLAKLFLEGNKMVWIEWPLNDEQYKNKGIVRCYPITSPDNTYKEIWSKTFPISPSSGKNIVTHQFFLSDNKDNIILKHKSFGKRADSSGNMQDFLEEINYKFNKFNGE